MNSADFALLVVDDNEDNRYTLTRRLKREGYSNVVTAVDGRQALKLLNTGKFDLVLLDIMMPEMNGYEVLAHLNAHPELRHTPVIMISAVDEMQSVIRCIELGAEDYLPKPFDTTLLRARVGASLEKKRLRDEVRRHALRMERELQTAREIQLSMVPTDFAGPVAAAPPEIFATLQPAREVGGDLYDFFWPTSDRLCLVVADVSDKGAGAALFMARAKTVTRLLASLLSGTAGCPPTTAEIVERANVELCQDNPQGMFVTLLFVTLTPTTGEIEWCNAGHCSPYIVRPEGEVEQLIGARGKPLGIRTGFQYVSETKRLALGESLFLYTDGITEAMNESGELFGEERLETSLRSRGCDSPCDVVSGVVQDVRSFSGAAAQADDIAALAYRRER